MNRKILALALFLLLILSAYCPVGFAHNADLTPNPNVWGAADPSTLVIDVVGEPESVDPAWIYDSASGELVSNVYETLVYYDRSYTDLGGYYQAVKTDRFVGRLATSWNSKVISETSPEGLAWVKRFTFETRAEVPFHNGAILTTEDVEYSFERWMVQDRDGGAVWMLLFWLFGDYYTQDPVTDPNFGLKISHAVERNSTHVWFNIMLPVPDLTFHQILSQPWSSIVNKAWVKGHGGLNIESVTGGWSNWTYIWNTWHNPWVSEIEGDMMGTGPYKFSYWDYGVSYSVVRFPEYWDGWPARKAEGSSERLPSYITTVVWNLYWDWTDRRTRFLNGNADMTTIDRMNRDQVLGQPGIRSWYGNDPPEWIVSLAVTGVFFNFNISTYPGGYNPYIPTVYPPDTFGPDGIPPNIFGRSLVINPGADEGLNVRKGFAHAFDYDAWLTSAYLGEGTHPSDPIIPGIAYDNPAQSKLAYNMSKAEYYLKLAWGGVDSRSGIPGEPVLPEDPAEVTPGALWNNGMKFSFVTTQSGISSGYLAFDMIIKKINSLNPLFHLQGPFFWPWGNHFRDILNGWVPIFMLGWLVDYPDPDNVIFPFMHSEGTFAPLQKYSNPRVDALIEAGETTADDTSPYYGELDQADPRPYFNSQGNIPPDTRWPRRSIYYELQAIYALGDIPSLILVTAKGRHWERDWVRGWYYDPARQGVSFGGGVFAYHLWKAVTHLGDANNDGHVDVVDVGVLSAHWSGPPEGSLGYNPMADLSGGSGGTTGSLSGPVVGIPDGRVDIVDVALINAYWDGPPTGPSHP